MEFDRIDDHDLLAEIQAAADQMRKITHNISLYVKQKEEILTLTPEQKTDKLESLEAENRLIKATNKQLRKECREWQNKTFSMKSEIDRMKSQLAGAEDRVRSAEQQADMAFVSMNEFRARVSELEYQRKGIKNQ